MKNIKLIVTPILLLATAAAIYAFTLNTSSPEKLGIELPQENTDIQMVNLFVTHGHCSSPFAGSVSDMQVITKARQDVGNPLETMKISFQIDPNSFQSCREDILTDRVKTPGLFIGENDEKITFRSTNVYTMGIDWYQVNGKLSIKGIEKDVKLFATGIRNPQDVAASELVLEGQMDLWDWGIDYDLIVNGESNPHPTKWMHLNMKIDLKKDKC